MPDTTDTLALVMARIDLLERELAEIKTVLRQPRGAAARADERGLVANRDPDIVRQQQRTGMQGFSPYVPPPR